MVVSYERYYTNIAAGSRYLPKETARWAGCGVSWWTPDRINALYTRLYIASRSEREKERGFGICPELSGSTLLRTHTYRGTEIDHSFRYKLFPSLFFLIAYVRPRYERSCIFHFLWSPHFLLIFFTKWLCCVPRGMWHEMITSRHKNV